MKYMYIENRGDGFLHTDSMMRMILNHYTKYDKKMLLGDGLFLLSREKEFSKSYCHSLICKI